VVDGETKENTFPLITTRVGIKEEGKLGVRHFLNRKNNKHIVKTNCEMRNFKLGVENALTKESKEK
jgi:hypothetical protein